MVPVASWVRVWSMRMPISSPTAQRPSTRWLSRIFRVRLLPNSVPPMDADVPIPAWGGSSTYISLPTQGSPTIT